MATNLTERLALEIIYLVKELSRIEISALTALAINLIISFFH